MEPTEELAFASGLHCESGIVVDGQLRTEDPAIRAIGDCAVSECYGRYQRVESVQNAVDQARFVARQIIAEQDGLPAARLFSAVPWFWTHQWDLKLQIAGIISESVDEVVTRGTPGDHSFSAFCYSSGLLTAVESVNRPRDHLAARKLLEAKVDLPPHLACDESVDLRQIASDAMVTAAA